MGKRNKVNKKQKLVVEFDANARREYILGMHKRKEKRREDAIENLKKQVKSLKKSERDEQRNLLAETIAKNKRERETQYSQFETEMDTARTVTELTGRESKTESKVIDDDFSQKMFGSGTVTVTTTTIESDEGSSDEETNLGAKSRGSQFFGKKNVKFTTGDAEKTLKRLLEKQKGRKSKTKLGSGARQAKRKKGKTGAKERRKRK